MKRAGKIWRRVTNRGPGSLPARRLLWYSCGAFLLIALGFLIFFHIRFSRMIDQQLSGNIFENTSRIFTAPRHVSVGDALSQSEFVGYLLRAGYSETENQSSFGRIVVSRSAAEARPSSRSFFQGSNALRFEFSGRKISRIRALDGGKWLSEAEIEPEVLTNLFDQTAREKRRFVSFADLPKLLVDAVLSAEDRRFFDHPGFDPIRILGAAWADVRRGAKAQGASTITMQVARTFFFSTRREWGRKLAEMYMALLLEKRFTKQQIFELYANQVYLGNRGSFVIRGFGEAAEAFFGKDVRQLTLGETAFLAGIIRAPNRYSSPERKPERAAQARDPVLAEMVDNRVLPAEKAEAAKKVPLRFVRATLDTSSSAYFVDMVQDQVLDRLPERELNPESYRVYTTLDPVLQRAAAQAVEIGMKKIDTQLARRYALWRKRGEEVPLPQVALVALDPTTGAIKALVGGRDYGQSQLNHALAQRQPGSAFKPFVYAAAFNTAVEGTTPVITPATTVVDEPTTFIFDGKPYAPDNYGGEYNGTVTLRDALTHSLNVAAVKVAEMAGYGHVVDIARRLGIDAHLQPTPAVALGAYEMTPLEVGAAYTVFANLATRVEPVFVSAMVSSQRGTIERAEPRRRSVLDPRVAYLVTNVLEDVINRGTGAVVRAFGFGAPAAGKTGTSRDGWFSGFTTNLLCVVWVGFDDNRELSLSGAASAAPIWAEFMKRAVACAGYRNVAPFPRPEGIAVATIDPQTGQLATPSCPAPREEVFIQGSQPQDTCSQHGGVLNQLSPTSWFRRIFGRNR
ncbi:MAG: penicillin-binding protein 1A [Acidobacteria bacterium]|nr:MAG: penicillin-binding protein 1A [Acidobacteriota bacterium]